VGQRLANGAKGVAHRAATNRRFAGRYDALSVAVSKDLKNWGGVGHVGCVGVEGEGTAEGFP